MSSRIRIIPIFFFSLFILGCKAPGMDPGEADSSLVERFGQLKVSGRHIIDQNDSIITLRGMSLFWSQWGGEYYTKATVDWLKADWKCTVIRAAVGIEHGGYLENPSDELLKCFAVIDACIDLGLYVIVDWHDHHAEDHTAEAVEFFGLVASRYGHLPNIIYEIYNEPLDLSWNEVLKPWSERIIAEIRKHDPDNIIVVGTPNWSQDVEDIAGNRIDDDNVMYSFHFYASTHTQTLRNKAITAIAADIPLFVTEWGLSEATGTGEIDFAATAVWLDFMEQNQLSWCNWSVINKDETSAALLPSTTAISGWETDELTESGQFIRNFLISKNGDLFSAEK